MCGPNQSKKHSTTLSLLLFVFCLLALPSVRAYSLDSQGQALELLDQQIQNLKDIRSLSHQASKENANLKQQLSTLQAEMKYSQTIIDEQSTSLQIIKNDLNSSQQVIKEQSTQLTVLSKLWEEEKISKQVWIQNYNQLLTLYKNLEGGLRTAETLNWVLGGVSVASIVTAVLIAIFK